MFVKRSEERAFPEEKFYLSEDSILQAIQQQNMFNVLDMQTGDKIDFWILTEEPFDQSRFSRKYTEDLIEFHMKVSCPEDTILAKLRWAKMSGGSEKQMTDVLRIYEIQREKLDENYIEKWANLLDVKNLFLEIKTKSD